MQSSLTKVIEGTQKDIFNYIANAIHRFTGFPVGIWAPAEDRKGLEIVASIGLPASYVQTAYLDLKKPSVTGDAYLSNKLRLVKDISTDSRWKYKDQAREMNWKSAICVPIDADGTIVGVISVYTYTERAILELKSLLPDYAKQIALTLDAARQRHALQQIIDIERNIQSITDNPKHLLASIVKAACDLTGADCAAAYPFDTERNEFYDIENVAAYGLIKPLNLTEKPRSKGGMASFIKSRGEALIKNIEQQYPDMRTTSSFIKREKIQAFMGITLRASGKVLGILYVNFRTPHTFTKQEKNTIRLFAHQAANALNNARLFQQVNLQIEALEKLHEASTSLTTIPATPGDLRETLNHIAQSAKQVLGADLIELYQYVQDQDYYDLPPIQVGEHYDKYVIKNIYKDDIIWTIVRRKKTMYTPNTQKSKALTKPFTVERLSGPERRFVIRENIKSSAAVPLMAGTEVLGVLFANYRTTQNFLNEQKKLIELFASQAAIAIRNARLFHQFYEYMQSLNGQMQALNDVAQQQKIDDVLQHVLIGINTILGEKTSSSINLYDEGRNNFYAYQSAGPLQDYLLSVPPRTLGSGGTGRFVIEKKIPLYLDDAQEPAKDTPTIRPESIKRGVCSFAALPLIRDKHVLGVLFVNSQKAISFTDGIKGILELFASQAAIAIENTRLYGRVNFLVRISQIITSQIDLDTVLNRVLEEIVNNFGAHFGTIQLTERTTGDLMIRAHHGKVIGKEYQRIGRGKGITGQAALSGKTILVNDLQDPQIREKSGYLEYFSETLAEVAVPIKVENWVIGVLNIEHLKPNAFNESDVELLEAIANQMATAIRNSTLNESLVNLGKATVSGGRLQEEQILDLIHRQAGRVMDTDNMYIALYDPDPSQPDQYNPQNLNVCTMNGIVRFGLVYVNGKQIDVENDPRWRPRKTGKGRSEEIIRTRKPILISTKTESEDWYAQLGHKEYTGDTWASWLGVPMIVGEKVLGVIATYHPTRDFVYTKDDMLALQAMANQVAIAFDNSYLFYNTNRRLTALVEFGKDITSEPHLSESQILEEIHNQAGQVMDTDNMYIALYVPDSGEPDDYAPEHPERSTMHGLVRFGLAYVGGQCIDIENEPSWQPRKAGKGKTEEIIRTRKPIFHATRAEADAWYAMPGHEEYVGGALPSWLGVPMLVGEKVLGVIATYHPTRDFVYSKDDFVLLQAMANQAAIALDNAELFYRERTAQKKIVEREAILARTSFAADFVHRINNLTGTIPGWVDLIRDYLREHKIANITLDEYLNNIEDEADNLLREAEKLKLPPQTAKIELGALLESLVRQANVQLPATVNIKLANENNLSSINAVQSELANAFWNVIENGMDAMKYNGRLDIKVKAVRNRQLLEVLISDEGPGIPEEMREEIYKPFATNKDGHMGYGLWRAKYVFENLGGTIDFKNNEPIGTTFIIRLPTS